MDTSTEKHEVQAPGLSRRQVLRGGVAAGATLLWVTPVISGIGLTSAHAAVASGSVTPSKTPTSTPTNTATNTPTNTATPTGTTTSSSPPASSSSPPPSGVLGEQFSQSPSPSPSVQGINLVTTPPTATLPFTGAAVPVTGAITLGAGLVAMGATAVVASRHRAQAAAATGVATEAAVAESTENTATKPEPPDAA